MHKLQTTILVPCLLLGGCLFGQVIGLDPTFGQAGIALTAVNNEFSVANDLALQPDGRIVTVGYTHDGVDPNILLCRFEADGTLDMSFGTNGSAIIDLSFIDDIGRAVALQPDGKIVVAGYSTYPGGFTEWLVARFDTNGQLDLGFGAGGIVSAPVFGWVYDVALQPDGFILVAGELWSNNVDELDFAVLRFDPVGDMDAAFGANGTVVLPLGDRTDSPRSIAMQPDGRILLGGYAELGVSHIPHFALLRLMSNGLRDTSFGTNGEVFTGFSNSAGSYGEEMDLLADGRIVLSGSVKDMVGDTTRFGLARYMPDGSLDLSFSGDGRTTTSMIQLSANATAMTTLDDGRMIVAGWGTTGGNPDIALARYLGNGELDLSFDEDGRISTFVTSDGSYPHAVTVQPDGKILIAGHGELQTLVARYITNSAEGLSEAASRAMDLLVFPDPAQDQATLRFELAAGSTLSIELLDASGHLVRTLFHGVRFPPGAHQRVLDLVGLAPGTYSVVLRTRDTARRAQLLKL